MRVAALLTCLQTTFHLTFGVRSYNDLGCGPEQRKGMRHSKASSHTGVALTAALPARMHGRRGRRGRRFGFAQTLPGAGSVT